MEEEEKNPLVELFEWDNIKRQEKIDKRQEYNRLLVQMVVDMIERCPDMRFGQILINLFPQIEKENFFYEEPCDTYYKNKLRGVNFNQIIGELIEKHGKDN